MRKIMDDAKLAFGFGQEDPQRVIDILAPMPGDHLLCIASAGEIPLTWLATRDGEVTAIDISRIQLKLTRLKLAASLALPTWDAAGFLGLTHAPAQARVKTLRNLQSNYLPPNDVDFWNDHLDLIRKGPIRSGKFEKYLSAFSPIARAIIGKKNLGLLLEASTIEAQERIFDELIAPRKMLHHLFKITFHPAIYGKGGIAQEALQYHGSKNPGEYFYRKFREFCTATPAKSNYFLQFFLLGECLHHEAFPEYLQPRHNATLRANQDKLALVHTSMLDHLCALPDRSLKRVHLSNIADWMHTDESTRMFRELHRTCAQDATLAYHYIHRPPEDYWMHGRFTAVQADELNTSNRYPFSELLQLRKHEPTGL